MASKKNKHIVLDYSTLTFEVVYGNLKDVEDHLIKEGEANSFCLEDYLTDYHVIDLNNRKEYTLSMPPSTIIFTEVKK